MHNHRNTPPIYSRRQMLQTCSTGFGAVALAGLLGERADSATGELPSGAALKTTHHAARAKHVIFCFMSGGVSHVDSFDPKPRLERDHGQPMPVKVERTMFNNNGNIMASPFNFTRSGQSGIPVSSMFPHVARHVDDLAFVMSMQSRTNVHGPASYLMNTGFLLPGFPCLGSWVSYGLGRLTDDLPTFVVLPDPRGLPYNQKGNFSSGFLPVTHTGTSLNLSAASPINDLLPPVEAQQITSASEREGLDPLAHYALLAERHEAPRPRPPFNLDARRRAGFTADELARLASARE